MYSNFLFKTKVAEHRFVFVFDLFTYIYVLSQVILIIVTSVVKK